MTWRPDDGPYSFDREEAEAVHTMHPDDRPSAAELAEEDYLDRTQRGVIQRDPAAVPLLVALQRSAEKAQAARRGDAA